MNEDKNHTGYPSIDKPWLKYYTREQIEAKLPKCKIYDYIWMQNKDYQERIALNYYNRRISYGQLFDSIAKAAKAYSQFGVRAGDVVSIISVTLPETIYSFYALNRIGAIANMIDPRTSRDGIREYLIEVGSKVVVIIDVAYEKVKEAVVGTLADKVVVISPADSLPVIKKQLFKLTKGVKIKENTTCIRWEHFLSKYQSDNEINDTEYRENECCVIVHTGGTTGTPKGVMLSNDNLNCSAFQCINSAIDFKREHNWIDIMPPFIAYGVGNGLHLPLVTGAEVVLIPAFDPNEFDALLMKYRPVHMVGVPSHYEAIINSTKLKGFDLSFIIAPVVGGDSIRRDLEIEVNRFFSEHGCKWNLVKGYGMTEVSAAVSVCTSNESNKIGGVGIPFAHTVISIFDTETGEELSYNQKGEVCMTGPNTMLGYYKNEAETSNILRKHADGKVWVHSGDLGYMDEDGQLFIEGRLKRMIVRHDGFKVYPSLIETVLLNSSDVNMCCVVGVNDTSHAQGRLPKAYVVLNEDKKPLCEEIKKELIMLCKEELPEYAQPQDICFIDQLPLTPIGKVNYLELEKSSV